MVGRYLIQSLSGVLQQQQQQEQHNGQHTSGSTFLRH
jgi:hypothetical protein